jgi:hypothetical protein
VAVLNARSVGLLNLHAVQVIGIEPERVIDRGHQVIKRRARRNCKLPPDLPQ